MKVQAACEPRKFAVANPEVLLVLFSLVEYRQLGVKSACSKRPKQLPTQFGDFWFLCNWAHLHGGCFEFPGPLQCRKSIYFHIFVSLVLPAKMNIHLTGMKPHVLLSHCFILTEASYDSFSVGDGGLYETIVFQTSMCGMKRDCGGAAGVLGAFYVAVKLVSLVCFLSFHDW